MPEVGQTEPRLRTFLRAAWVVLGILLAFELTRSAASDSGPGFHLETLVYLLPYVLSVGASTLAAVRSPRGDNRLFWICLAAVSWFILIIEVSYAVSVAQGTQAEMIMGPWGYVLAGIPAVLFAYLLATLSRATEAALPSRLHYLATGLITVTLVFLMSYGMLVEPFLDQLGLDNHAIQAQTAYRLAIGFTVLLGTFLNVGALKASAWRRWELFTIGGIAVYALGLCLEPLVVASELGWTSYSEQMAEALWMTGQFLIFLGAVTYLASDQRGVPVRRHVPSALLAGGWTSIAFDAFTLISTMAMLAASFVADSAFERTLYLTSSIVLAVLFLCREAFGAIATGRLLNASVLDLSTRLYNARHFSETLESEIDTAVRTGEPLTVAVLDLDDLELMDTVEGFGSSERAIQAVGSAIRGIAGSDLFAARLGWDQFGLLLAETLAPQARSRASSVCERRSSPLPASQPRQASRPSPRTRSKLKSCAGLPRARSTTPRNMARTGRWCTTAPSSDT